MLREGYGTWSVCVSQSVSTLISYLAQLRIEQEICTSDFSVTWAVKIKMHFVSKCSVRKLERYVLTTDRSAILSNVHSP